MKSRSAHEEIPSIIVINPISSPKYLSEELKKYGINCVAIFTALKEKILPYFQASRDLFDQQIYLDSPSVDDVAAILAETFSREKSLYGFSELFSNRHYLSIA